MVKWTRFLGTSVEWSDYLQKASFSSMYQSYEWGEVKKRDGWQILRFVGADSKNPVSIAQVFMKRLPGKGAFFWCPGGILGDFSSFDIRQFSRELNFKFFYFRCSFHDPDLKNEDLNANGWKRPSYSINSNLCMQISLKASEDELLANMSSNWRHNLKRFGKKNVSVERWARPDAALLYKHYQSFEAMKGLGSQHSLNSIQGVIEEFGDKLVILRALDENGELLALRGYIQFGQRALDWFAISTEAGRSCYASHGVLWAVLKDAKTRGVDLYDLSGVDPVNNAGVYNFKKGIGAHEVRYPGEFEKASNRILAFALNKIMKRRLANN